PVIGAALFLRYGSAHPVTGIYWWASLKPTLRMGDWSYAIYLWHWPLIIVATYQIESFTWPYKFGVIALTFILSAASQQLIEDPLRHAKSFKIPKRAFMLMASNMAIIATLTFFVPQLLAPDTNQEVAIEECTGANALFNSCEDTGATGEPNISPAQVQREAEEPAYTECIVPEEYVENTGCSLGASEENADHTIAILGDSHARAWLPMLDEIGAQNNWNIQGYTKSGCTPVPLPSAPPSSDQEGEQKASECQQFVTETSEELKNNENVETIIMAASPTDRKFYDEDGSSSDEIAIEALTEMWQEWDNADKEVII